MELRLSNFRCYRDKTFVFPKGVLLIDGPSGKGKTTILTAIKYALFGKVTQISTYGEKKTSVTLMYNGIKVVRTNVPSRLLVTYGDKMIEDDAAQEYIYQLFGRQFELTSYMVQKGAIQFFTLSGADKLKLLEQLSLLGEDHIQQMKDSIQRDMKEKKRQTERLESQIELLESQLGSKPTLIKKKGFLTLLDIQRMIDFISSTKKSWEEQRTHCTILLQTYADQLKTQRSEKMARDSVIHSLRHDRSELDRLTEEKNVNEVDEYEITRLQQQLLEYDQYSVFQQKQKEWHEKTKVYEELIQQETDRIALQMNEWKQKMVPMTDSVENVRIQIRHVEQINIQWKQIRDLSHSLQKEESLKSQIDDLRVEDCTLYQLQMEYHDQYLFYQSVEKELHEIKKRYQEQIFSYQYEIQELQSRLRQEPTLRDEKEQVQICTEQLVTWKRIHIIRMELSNEKMVDIQSRFEATTRQKEKMEKMLSSMEIRKRVQSCPQCNTSLIIHTNQIVSASHQPISESDKKTEEKYKTELPKWQKQYENQYRLLLSRDELKKEEEILLVKVHESEEELQFRLKTLTSYLESISEIQHHNRVIQKQLDEKQDPIVKYRELELKWKEMEHTLMKLPKGEYFDSIDIVKEKVLRMKYKKEQEKALFQQWVDAQQETKRLPQESIRFVSSYRRFMSHGVWDPDFFTYMDGKKEEELPIQELYQTLEQLIRHQQSNEIIQEQIKSLVSSQPHVTYESMKVSLDEIKKELDLLPQGSNCIHPDQVRIRWNQCVAMKKEYDRIVIMIEKVNKQLVEKERELDVPFDDTDYESMMSHVMTQQSLINEKIIIPTKQVEEFSSYYEQVKRYLSHRKKERDLHDKKIRCAIYYSQLEQLESLFQHILYSEGVCLEQFIRRVNLKMKWYLDHFFEDQSLQMELCSEKECKSGKIKNEICVQLTQHQQSCELKNLSGGEYDRCALAFMLTINELSHSPCLFLDESISSLDMSLSEHVLEVIKEKQSELGKIVLLISHQANTGFFDHVIKI